MSESRPIEVGFRVPPETPRPGPTVRARVTRVDAAGARERDDLLATEEPLEIRVIHRGIEHVVGVTMRTPGNDFELAAGFLFAEGMIGARSDLEKVSYCASGPPEQLYNVVTVELTTSAPFDPERLQRNFATNSSCGVCGKASLDALEVRCAPLADGFVADARIFPTLPDALREKQKVFSRTGGLHAAGSFSCDGTLHQLREDVGRHNAVDKLVGAMLMNDELPGRETIMQVSGRASFEIVQKALMAEIPIIAAVSAPSSLAVSLAERFNVTLAGFVRDEGFNIYSGPSRIRIASS